MTDWTPDTRREAGCRMCSECVGYSHHWLDDCLLVQDPVEGDVLAASHSCKHCEVRGMECNQCLGTGIQYADDDESPSGEVAENCERCEGEGVYPVYPCQDCGEYSETTICGVCHHYRSRDDELDHDGKL